MAPTGRIFVGSVACAIALLPTLKSGAEASPYQINITALAFGTSPEVDASLIAAITIGLRRGISQEEGVRFVHPVDVLSPPEITEELQMA
ncbi:MAG: hypothetical protein RMJ84_12315, partial [Sandaracinaceae bacterium]|nr:hypothetical protein [Sandaracinaceae bacterium]